VARWTPVKGLRNGTRHVTFSGMIVDADTRIVLGSRSPQRFELLQKLVTPSRILVCPPTDTEEAGFEGLATHADIKQRLRQIARSKCDDVLRLLQQRSEVNVEAVIAADTTIVAADERARPVVLGQPPEGDSWPDAVRSWFLDFYAGKTHLAATAVCVALPQGRIVERLVESEVTFRTDVERWLDWYLATGEPAGKAGGYAIQGLGSIFVSRIEGSQSNVIGLPLEALLEIFEESDIEVG